MKKILVCPVAFNENVKLKRVIERLLRCSSRAAYDYLVVDDGSTDGTSAMIAGFGTDGVMTVRHPSQQGVGAAIRTAIHYGRDNGYEIIVIMAGNDKDEPEEIVRLLAPIQNDGFDVVQGSRYLGGERTGGDMPFYRKLATRLHPFLFTVFTGHRMTDTTNGFRAIRLAIFADKRIDLEQQWLNAYELEPYILFKAVKVGCRVTEVPVTKIYPPKKQGYTKMKPIVGWWSILRPLVYLGLGIKR